MYEIKTDVPVPAGRSGPKLSKFPLDKMEVGNSFLIPFKPRVIKGKQRMSTERGFNVKAANKEFAPKVFKKSRTENGVLVHRIE